MKRMVSQTVRRLHNQTPLGAAPPPPGGPVRIARWRIYVLLILALLCVGRLALRLGEVQILEQATYAEMARKEISQEVTIPANRGLITDRAGNVLAMDIERESLWVIPRLIDQDSTDQLAVTLAALLELDIQTVEEALTAEGVYWTRLARWLEPAVARQIESLGEDGLQLVYEPMRYYPQEDFAAHVVGAVNHVGDGISGVESYYNEALKGITGTITAEFDPADNPIAIAPQQMQPARHGVDLVLTIDPFVQYVAETELQKAVEAHDADGGSVVVLEVKTGAIRGMASWPSFNPNHFERYDPATYSRNPAVNALYEPGSTFKMVTVAAGLQTGAFTADTPLHDTGVTYRHGQMLKNWNAGANGIINPGDMLYYSSNIGALQLVEMMGPTDFYQMVRAFGFGELSGVDLGGEEIGIIHDTDPRHYNGLTLLTNSYGQGISVTPLQMTQAAAVIANDGVLMQPYVVEKICEDGECKETRPTARRQVIDPGVAWTVRRMLVRSANHYAPVVWAGQTGSYGDQWLVPGYQVGAKTGTSSIPIAGGGYDPNFTIGSVLGFAPAEDARYAVLVKVDRPRDDIWGVATAIPLYYHVVEQLLRYEGIPPDPHLRSPGQ
jgi:cell division protein FtsI (penicillin-binding protein 3)